MEWCTWLVVRNPDAEGWHGLVNTSPPHCTEKLYLDEKQLVYSLSYVLTPLTGGTPDGSESLRRFCQSRTEDSGRRRKGLVKTNLSPAVENFISEKKLVYSF